MTEPETFLTVAQVARRLSLNPETVRRWVRSGRLRAFKPGGDKSGWRVSERSLDALINARSNVQKETEQ